MLNVFDFVDEFHRQGKWNHLCHENSFVFCFVFFLYWVFDFLIQINITTNAVCPLLGRMMTISK